MATRIFRVDLADDADDFQHIALEPGLPLIDQANVNSQILFKWCGDLVAAPQIEGTSVNYFVRNPEQGRLSGVTATPATEKDLAGPLKEQLEELQRLLRKAKPETSTEQAVHTTAKATLKKLTDEGASTLARQSALFKYRHEKGPLRLVWCWGFQRKETQPAPTAICRNPQCNLLFLNRPGMKSRCPACQQVSRRKKARGPLVGALPLLLLLLIAAGVTFWFLNQPRLVVVPAAEISVPVGSRVAFVVHRMTLLSDEDVSDQVAALSNNTRVLALRPGSLDARAKARGQAIVHFVLGGIAAEASVSVDPRGNPGELFFEPADIELGVGATHRLKVMGRYDDGDFDLTDATRFEPDDTSFVHVNGALVQGTAAGSTKIRAMFRSASDSQAVETTASVEVKPRKFKELALSVSPLTLDIGQAGRIEATATAEDGATESVVGSGMLTLKVEPADGARVEDGYLYAKKAGKVTLTATFGGLSPETAEITIGESAGDLLVTPAELALAVDERYYLDVSAGEPYTITSSDPNIVRPRSAAERPADVNVVVAVTEGTVDLVVRTDSGQEKTIKVTVTPAKYASIAFETSDTTVAVGESAPLRIVGVTAEGTEIELDGKKLTWKHPDPKFVTINTDSMYLRGEQLTGDKPQTIGVSYGGHEATSLVAVVAGAPESSDPLWAILGKGSGLKHHDTIPFVEQQVVKTYPTYDIVEGKHVVTTVPTDPIFGRIFHEGDVVTSIGGRVLTGTDDIDVITRGYVGGLERIPYEIIRDGVPMTVYLEPDVQVVQRTTGTSDESTFTVVVTVRAPKELPGTQIRLSDQNSKLAGPWVMLDPDSMTATVTSPPLKHRGFDVGYPTFVETKPPTGAPKSYSYTFRLKPTVEDSSSTVRGVNSVPGKVVPAPRNDVVLPPLPKNRSVEEALKDAL